MSSHEEFEHLRIPFPDIKVATKNFTTIIGRGGYGPVYRGELSIHGNLTSVAVKRLPQVSLFGQGVKEFLTEIKFLSGLRHPNLVSLVGYCDEANEKLLIYEFVNNGSLDNYLHMGSCLFTCKQRIDICIDVARGLDYLHNHAQENNRIIHLDIKSANILLDLNLKAKIGDFGFSKTRPRYEDMVNSSMGTPGYRDPKYIETGKFTYKSDVYSFGVVLFEVLCGRLCFMNVNGKPSFLLPLVRRCYSEGKLHEILDRDLKESESVKEFSKIAYQCLQYNPKERPSMDFVLQKLQNVLNLHNELEDASESQISLTLQASRVHNDQQQLNQLPSRESMRPNVMSLIYALENNYSLNNEKLPSLPDFDYGHGISNNGHGNSGGEYDLGGQPLSVGAMTNVRISKYSNMGDPAYADDRAPVISELARPQPSQTGKSFISIQTSSNS